LGIETSNHTPSLDDLDFRAIFRSATSVALIVVSSDDFVILETNEAAERLYGYAPGTLTGTSFLTRVSEPELTRSDLVRLSDGHQEVPARGIHIRQDSSRFPVNVSASVSTIRDHRVLCLFVQDASGIERTERELIRSDQRFRAVADYTYDWENWLDSNGNLVWVNPAVYRFTGFTADECLEMNEYPLPLVEPDDVSIVRQIIDSALCGSTGNDVEFRALHKDGQSKWIAVSWQPLRDDRNAQIGVRMSMRDIDQRKAMERQVQLFASEMEKLAEVRARRIVKLKQEKAHIEKLASLGELAASVAHEISNPLAGIKNALRLVIDMVPPNGESSELLRLVDQEIARLTALLRQMYQLYRPRTEPPKPLNLAAIVRDLLLLNEGTRSARDLNIRFVDRFGPDKLVLPEIELRQVLQNLLTNAIEASEVGGSIEIVCDRTADGDSRITVTDYGCGIPSEIVNQIFEPFFTTKATPGKSGSGLGLAITRSLVEAMGGAISVEPVSEGGTTFELRFPGTNSEDSFEESGIRE
jgi:PAS domain S-box-containing protein